MKTLTDIYIELVLTPMMKSLFEKWKCEGLLPDTPAIEIDYSNPYPEISIVSFGGAK